MAFYTRPENEAQFVQMFSNGVPNTKAYALMPKDTVALLPTSPENIGKQVRIDAAWWAKNVDEVTKRWLVFVGSEVKHESRPRITNYSLESLRRCNRNSFHNSPPRDRLQDRPSHWLPGVPRPRLSIAAPPR